MQPTCQTSASYGHEYSERRLQYNERQAPMCHVQEEHLCRAPEERHRPDEHEQRPHEDRHPPVQRRHPAATGPREWLRRLILLTSEDSRDAETRLSPRPLHRYFFVYYQLTNNLYLVMLGLFTHNISREPPVCLFSCEQGQKIGILSEL